MNLSEARSHPLVEYARTNLWGSGITTIPEQFEAAFDNLSSDDQQLSHFFHCRHRLLSRTPYFS